MLQRIGSPPASRRSRPARRSRGSRPVDAARHELVEAGERVGLSIDLELLPARDEAIGSKNEESEVGSLPDTSAGTVSAGSDPPQDARIGSQGEDIVMACN